MRIEFDADRDLVTVSLLPDVPVVNSNEVGGMVIGRAADHCIVHIAISGARERIDRELQKTVALGAGPSGS